VLGFTGDNTSYEVQLTGHGPLVSLLAMTSLVVPERRVDEAVRLVNWLNATRLRWGCFWIHPKSRHLAFELAIVAPDELSQDQIALALGAVPFDRFYPAIAKVIWANCSVAEALDEAANDDSTDLAV
jgi:hypothetical protein